MMMTPITSYIIEKLQVKQNHEHREKVVPNGNAELRSLLKERSKNKIVDISDIDTRNVTTMRNLFRDCENITYIIGLDQLDTHNVTDMSNMFSWCKNADNLNDAESFDVSRVEKFDSMFAHTKIPSFDLKNWNTTEATSMEYMFQESGIKHIDLRSLDTSNIRSISGMFAYSKDLEVVDMSGLEWPKLKKINYMFSGCNKLREVIGLKKILEDDRITWWSIHDNIGKVKIS